MGGPEFRRQGGAYARGRKEIKKALFTDIDCACRSIVWLAENTSAANNEVVESGVTNARCGGDAYPVTWQGQSYEVEWHINNGNSRAPERCLRIYYFWDGDQVVVTHMPSHQKTSMSYVLSAFAPPWHAIWDNGWFFGLVPLV